MVRKQGIGRQRSLSESLADSPFPRDVTDRQRSRRSLLALLKDIDGFNYKNNTGPTFHILVHQEEWQLTRLPDTQTEGRMPRYRVADLRECISVENIHSSWKEEREMDAKEVYQRYSLLLSSHGSQLTITDYSSVSGSQYNSTESLYTADSERSQTLSPTTQQAPIRTQKKNSRSRYSSQPSLLEEGVEEYATLGGKRYQSCEDLVNQWEQNKKSKEIEVDVPAIDPSKPYKEPPCPLDRRAPVRMSFRVSSKAVGKESRYDFLRRKLSLRVEASAERSQRHNAATDKPHPQKAYAVPKLAVCPETGERAPPSNSAFKRPSPPRASVPVQCRGTLSQPALTSYGEAVSQTSSNRRLHTKSVSPMVRSSGRAQVTTETIAHDRHWSRASSAVAPSTQTPSYGYTRVTSCGRPSFSQFDRLHPALVSQRTSSPHLIKAPHLAREQTDGRRSRTVCPSPQREQRLSVGSDLESETSRRRHRSQSPASILNRAHNENKYGQVRVRSHSSERYLAVEDPLKNQKKRSNSVDLDLLSPVDNTCGRPVCHSYKNRHDLDLKKKFKGGSTYTTSTSEYTRRPHRKHGMNSQLSQSTEYLSQNLYKPLLEEDEEVFKPRLHASSYKEEQVERKLPRASADSGYTSPIEHFGQKEISPFRYGSKSSTSMSSVIGPKESIDLSFW